MALITKQEALRALKRLGELASAAGQRADLLRLGGGAMVLRFDARLSTKDLDVVMAGAHELGLSAQLGGGGC